MSSDTYHKTIVDAFMRDAKIGRAWLALDARELFVLDQLKPSTILEIRNSAEHSFRTFRRDLGKTVDEIQELDLENEQAYREAANQAWQRVRESAEMVRRDLPKIEKKLKVEGIATTGLVSLTPSLVPAAPSAAFGSGVRADHVILGRCETSTIEPIYYAK